MGIFWLGLVLLRPFARKLLPPEPGVNGTLTMYLQYFGIIYGTPFRGEIGVSPEALELVYHQMQQD